MSDQLVIRVIDASSINADTAVDWQLFGIHGHIIQQGKSLLHEIAALVNLQTSEYTLTVIAPANAFLLAVTNIPSRQIRQVKQALPFMVEELIAEDIDSVHIAIPNKLNTDNQQVDFAVISHRLLIDLLDQFYRQQLSPNKLLVDTLCLPQQNNGISLLLDGEQWLVRTGDYSGMSIAIEDATIVLPILLESYQQRHHDPLLTSIQLMCSESDQSAEQRLLALSQFIAKDLSQHDCKTSSYQESVSELIAANSVIEHNQQLNILQGGYTVKGEQVNLWQRWAVASSVAVVGLLAYLALTLGGGWYFNHQANTLDAEAMVLYKQFFPDERRVVSPRKQLENYLRLNNVDANSHFLQLLANTATALTENREQSLLVVEQLRFDREQGELQFQVQSASITQLDLLKQRLGQVGMEVEINSASEEGDYVIGRLVVRSM